MRLINLFKNLVVAPTGGYDEIHNPWNDFCILMVISLKTLEKVVVRVRIQEIILEILVLILVEMKADRIIFTRGV